MQKVITLIIILMMFSCSKKTLEIHSGKNNSLIKKYSEILQIPESEITSLDLYVFIDDWYGTKYKYGGTSKAGVDCSGFTNVLYSNVYKKELKRRAVEIAEDINKVSKGKLKEGDLVFFNISKKKNSHVGVYLKNNKFVHASTSKGVIISSLENPYYQKAYNKGGGLK